MKKAVIAIFLSALFLGMTPGCADTNSHATGVYMLLDTSGTYTEELKKAQAIINYLLGTLQPGDSLSVARIDSGSFSEKDIIAKMTFDTRPSVSNRQKLKFRADVDENVKKVKGSPYTDISGGILQAIEYLNETRAGKKYILVFSDMKEDLPNGYVRDVPFGLKGFNVVAINVTKLRTDNVNPREYIDRLEKWRKRVEEGNGSWKVVNDPERLERILDMG
jgi:hypothetical protein